MFLLWPGQTHFVEVVEVDLGIDEGGAQTTMAQHIGNRLEGMALIQHSGGKAVAKEMRAPTGALDAGFINILAHELREVAGTAQRLIGRAGGQEYLGAGTSGAALLQIRK